MGARTRGALVGREGGAPFAGSSSLPEPAQLALLFCVAFALRCAYGLPQAFLPTLNDMGVYHQLALGLWSGEGYVSALEPHFQSFRAPGYPFFLAAVYALVGESPLAVVVLQSALGAFTCVLVHGIGRACFDRTVGMGAALLCLIDPEMIHWTPKYVSETLFVFLLALLVRLAVRGGPASAATQRAQLARLVALGVVLGLGILTRPNLLLFVPFLVLYYLFCHAAPWTRRLLWAGLPVAIAVLVLLPWTLRNHRVHGQFVPVATIGGYALFVGIPPAGPPPADPGGKGESAEATDVWSFLEAGRHLMPSGYDMAYELMGGEPIHSLPADFDEVRESRRGRAIFLERVRQDPFAFLKLCLAKLSLTFNVLPKVYRADLMEDYGFGRGDVLVRWYSAAFLLVAWVFAPLGLAAGLRVRAPVMLLALVLLYHVGFQSLFRPALRYFLPGLVLGSVFTAAGLRAALDAWRARSFVPSMTRGRRAAALLAVVALLANGVFQAVVLRHDRIAADARVLLEILGVH